ncbi:MAG: hypothetical protein ACREKM_08500 [Longimicrobiales bacterium]
MRRDETTGLYRGPSRIDLHTRRDGRIGSIELHYPDSTTFDVLLNRLTAEFGPAGAYEDRYIRMAVWAAWTESISLHERLQQESGTTIMISSLY